MHAYKPALNSEQHGWLQQWVDEVRTGIRHFLEIFSLAVPVELIRSSDDMHHHLVLWAKPLCLFNVESDAWESTGTSAFRLVPFGN